MVARWHLARATSGSIKICSFIIYSQTALRVPNSRKLFSKKHNLNVYANYVQCNFALLLDCWLSKRVCHDLLWFSWQGLKIATWQIWLHNSLGSPPQVNKLHKISASIEAAGKFFYSVTNSTGATQHFSPNHKTSSEQKNRSSFIFSDQIKVRPNLTWNWCERQCERWLRRFYLRQNVVHFHHRKGK